MYPAKYTCEGCTSETWTQDSREKISQGMPRGLFFPLRNQSLTVLSWCREFWLCLVPRRKMRSLLLYSLNPSLDVDVKCHTLSCTHLHHSGHPQMDSKFSSPVTLKLRRSSESLSLKGPHIWDKFPSPFSHLCHTKGRRWRRRFGGSAKKPTPVWILLLTHLKG